MSTGTEPDPLTGPPLGASQRRHDHCALSRRAWVHSDATIDALDLESVGRVPWWPPGRNEVSLHRILIHVATETHRHAGHADILRELIDGSAGLRPGNHNFTEVDAAWWADYRARIEQSASSFKSGKGNHGRVILDPDQLRSWLQCDR